MGSRFDRRPAEGGSTTIKKIGVGYNATKDYKRSIIGLSITTIIVLLISVPIKTGIVYFAAILVVALLGAVLNFIFAMIADAFYKSTNMNFN